MNTNTNIATGDRVTITHRNTDNGNVVTIHGVVLDIRPTDTDTVIALIDVDDNGGRMWTPVQNLRPDTAPARPGTSGPDRPIIEGDYVEWTWRVAGGAVRGTVKSIAYPAARVEVDGMMGATTILLPLDELRSAVEPDRIDDIATGTRVLFRMYDAESGDITSGTVTGHRGDGIHVIRADADGGTYTVPRHFIIDAAAEPLPTPGDDD
ncbi:hypothetical protein SEA_AMOCHICK_3 [Mycobacterium phage Amochick]|uniref:Uncharacterized protein n=1 Tax=Mycobacterium phage Amochick TaxID=2301540 RepID=A0A385D025_9CAUD|nr:hypothetical protein SEA_AMOCHICK_3 [Mycobacterium phage Amochick]